MTPQEVEIWTLRRHKASLQKRVQELEQRLQESERMLVGYLRRLHRAEEQNHYMQDSINVCSGSCSLPPGLSPEEAQQV